MRGATVASGVLLLALASRALILMPDRYCLACICNASTNCSPRIGCRRQHGQLVCGPFLLTADAWRRARASGGTFAKRFRYLNYRTCANDGACASEALSQYLSQSASDCDGDGRVTCKDFGIMNRAGVSGCRNRTEARRMMRSAYYRVLESCLVDVTVMLQQPKLRSGCRYEA
ncbi:lysozyme-like [Pollicipes pollicipes]|uniref:lysozyme-like n=1 Tax=Pollicipes pollicipes TaxID=41117 RepID=UPI00188495E3|nr:lysozyme-like [Pollicipes pollicipes]